MCSSKHCAVYSMLNGAMHDHFRNDRTTLGRNSNTSNFPCPTYILKGFKYKRYKLKMCNVFFLFSNFVSHSYKKVKTICSIFCSTFIQFSILLFLLKWKIRCLLKSCNRTFCTILSTVYLSERDITVCKSRRTKWKQYIRSWVFYLSHIEFCS